MEQQHTPSEEQLYHAGADADTDVNLKEKGTYVDSQNMRPTSLDGHSGAINKIHGEVVQYPNIDNHCGGTGLPLSLTYKCIASIQVLNHLVEFWADRNAVLVPYVRVDGWVVLYPTSIADFPISVANPPQVDKNSSCVGGLVFYTDNSGVCPPFFLNVTDMLTNAGVVNGVQNCDNATQKYYSEFNIDEYSINSTLQLDHPIFIECCAANATNNLFPNSLTIVQKGGGGGGLPPGKVQYSYCYVDSSGNATNYVPFSPVVSIPISIGYSWGGSAAPENVFPGSQVFGGDAAATLTQHLAMHIRFRITNILNYASVNVRRILWNTDAAIGSLGTDEIINNFNINPGFIGVVDFFDTDDSSVEPTPTQTASDGLAAITAAKAIRYFDQRLNLMNITYQSLVVNPTIGNNYPFVRSLGVEGYKDLWNEAYRKSYFRGEKYNMAFVGYDSQGNSSFAGNVIPAGVGGQMPNRRDALTGASLTQSIEAQRDSNVLTAYNSSNAVSQTYEVFDSFSLQQRDPSRGSAGFFQTISVTKSSSIADKAPGYKTQAIAGYSPFRPVNQTNLSGTPYQSYNYLPTIAVNDGNTTDATMVSVTGGASLMTNTSLSSLSQLFPLAYNPQGFAPDLYALGQSFEGITDIPSYISAFTIVRSVPANSVIAQGQSYYDLVPNGSGIYTAKSLGNIVWDSPDVYAAISPAPGINYSAQIVAPVGLFSEVYQGYSGISPIINGYGSGQYSGIQNGQSTEIDMITYPRVVNDTNGGATNKINPASTANQNMKGVLYVPNGCYYTTWDSWRNTASGLVTANQVLGINSATQNGTLGYLPRQNTWNINLASAIYANQTNGSDYDFNDAGVKAFHEPLYVVNIVNPTATVPVTNSQSYIQTECYVKVSAIIGSFNPSNLNYPLVDERWQDCIPALLSTDWNANTSSYIYIQEPITQSTQTWLNVTYLTPAAIAAIQSDIATNGFYASTNKCGNTVNVTGIYTHTITPAVPNPINGIYPSESNNLYTIVLNYSTPSAGDYIIIKYDPCTNIEVFGGDAYIGEYNYPIIDQNITAGSVDVAPPLPYRSYHYNDNTVTVFNPNDTTGSSPGLEIQAWNIVNQTFKGSYPNQLIGGFKQLICNGIVESRVNTAMGYGGNEYTCFPTVNYIMKPLNFDSSNYGDNVYPIYLTDYNISSDSPFNYGGFQVMNQPNGGLSFNNDYSENANNIPFNSKPTVGFTEQLTFCSLCVYSAKEVTNQQNAPNLKTFPILNQYTLDDATGEIKRAYNQLDRYGDNLYVFTENGIALLLTNKQLLTEQSGQTLALMGNTDSTYIQDAQFVSRSVGMNDQTWRTAAEWNNQIWFANKSDVYKFSPEGLRSISEGYTSVIKNMLQNIGEGYSTDISAVWDNKYKEYRLNLNTTKILIQGNTTQYFWSAPNTPSGTRVYQDSIIDYQATANANIENVDSSLLTELYFINNSGITITVKCSALVTLTMLPGITYRFYYTNQWNIDNDFTNLCNDLVYSEEVHQGNRKGAWAGQYKYLFDQYMSDISDNVYGSRYGATFKLDSGYAMNGALVDAWVTQSCAADLGKSKEFWRCRFNVETEPDIINFYLSRDSYQNNNVYCNINTITTPYGLKNYGKGYEQYTPRGSSSPFYRTQGNYLIFQTLYSQPEEFRLYSSEIRYKLLV